MCSLPVKDYRLVLMLTIIHCIVDLAVFEYSISLFVQEQSLKFSASELHSTPNTSFALIFDKHMCKKSYIFIIEEFNYLAYGTIFKIIGSIYWVLQ